MASTTTSSIYSAVLPTPGVAMFFRTTAHTRRLELVGRDSRDSVVRRAFRDHRGRGCSSAMEQHLRPSSAHPRRPLLRALTRTISACGGSRLKVWLPWRAIQRLPIIDNVLPPALLYVYFALAVLVAVGSARLSAVSACLQVAGALVVALVLHPGGR